MTELFPGADGSGDPSEPRTGDYQNEYGFGATADRLAALAPPPAISLDETDIDQDKITTPDAGIPVWAELAYPHGRAATVHAFAQKWTPNAVYVQYVERSLAAYRWVRRAKHAIANSKSYELDNYHSPRKRQGSGL